MVVFIGLMVNTFIEDPVTALIGFVVPAVGCIVYLYFDKQLKNNTK